MASIDPWTGARLGDMDDAMLGGFYLAEIVIELRKLVCPSFPTVAARDAAVAALVTAGVPATNGMSCWTDDVGFWDRVGGVWMPRPHFSDTGWVALTPTTGWTPITAGGEAGLRYRIINNGCWLQFRINGNNAWAGGNTVFTLPAGARPTANANLRVTKDNNDGVSSGQLRIHPDGTAVIDIAGLAGSDIYGTGSFLVN